MMNVRPIPIVGAVLAAAVLALGAAPLQARTHAYGGIGATVANFYAANPHGAGTPPAGTTYYQVDDSRGGRVSSYHVVVDASSNRSGHQLLALMSGRELPADAQVVKPYNGICKVYRSRWLGKVIFRLPQRFGTRRVFRFGYIVMYASARNQTAGLMASLVPLCRG